MTKTYQSMRLLSFSVTMSTGSYKHIKFLPYSFGGGIYTTKNEEEQKAIEKEKEYGVAYWLMNTQADEPDAQQEEAAPVEMEQVQVNDLDEAKDYLIENKGCLRSKLRSKVAILEAAQENGIEFVGI